MARILGPILGLSLYGLTPGHLLPYLFGGLVLLAMLPLIPSIRRGGNESGGSDTAIKAAGDAGIQEMP